MSATGGLRRRKSAVTGVSVEDRQQKRSQINIRLLIATVCCALGTATIFLDAQITVQLAGYVLGSLIPLGFVAAARRGTKRLELESGATTSKILSAIMLAVVAIAVVAAGFHAYFVAQHVGAWW